MPFERPPKFERPTVEDGKEIEEQCEKEKKSLEELMDKTRKIPGDLKKRYNLEVGEDCRLDIEVFKDLYYSAEHEVEKDKRCVARDEEKFKKEEEVEPKKKIDRLIGEQLELLTQAIFYKFLKEDFVVVRVNRFDDLKNKVDHLILHREDLTTFALDTKTAGAMFEKEKEETLNRNIKKEETEGARIKYGLQVDADGKVRFAQREKIPILCLGLDREKIKTGIKELNPDLNQISEYEKFLFKALFSQVKKQIIKDLLQHRKLSYEMKRKVDDLGVFLLKECERKYHFLSKKCFRP